MTRRCAKRDCNAPAVKVHAMNVASPSPSVSIAACATHDEWAAHVAATGRS